MDQASIKVVQELTRTGRRLRNPVHNWQVRAKPWVIQPICIAPVLPGETLKNILVQARIVTDPIVNGLVGWWTEQHWFYVKLRDLPTAIASAYSELMITPGSVMTAVHSAAKTDTYHGYATSVDPTQACLEVVTDRFSATKTRRGTPPAQPSALCRWLLCLATMASPDGWTVSLTPPSSPTAAPSRAARRPKASTRSSTPTSTSAT